MGLKPNFAFNKSMIPPFGAPQDFSGSTNLNGIYVAEATQRYVLGTKYETWDGRVFRYAKAGGTALVQAYMTQTAVKDSKFVEIAQTSHAQSVGSTEITVLCTTGSAAGENDFSGGWLVCNKVSPAVLGDIYGIISSKLQSTDTLLDLTLDCPWRNAMLATGEISLNYSQFFKTVVVPATTITAPPAGVPLCPVPIGYYYWSQVKGPAPIVVDTGDTLVIGAYAGIPGTNAVAGTCGTVDVAGAGAFPFYGRVMSIATAAEPALINLMLE